MHRNRTWTLDPPEWRTQRNRLLPIEGGDGSTLNLDFTTGVLDPRLTFFRSTNATFVNSSGHIQYANANMLADSELFSVANGWQHNGVGVPTIDTAITNPSGGIGAPKVTVVGSGGSKSLVYSQPVVAGFKYTFRLWVRAAPSSSLSIGYYNASFLGCTLTKISGPGTIAGGTGTSYQTITNLSTSEWTQIQLVLDTIITSGSGQLYIYPNGVSNAINDAVYIWGTQANLGDTANPYYKTTTTGYYAPRFDYDPTNLAAKGLLIEGVATNLNIYSEDFANAAWTKSGISTTAASGISPDNKNTATLISENIGGFIKHSVEKSTNSITVNAGNIYTFSVFLKEPTSNSRRYACIQVADGSATALRNTIVVDLQTGTVTASGVTGAVTNANHRVVKYPNGWYRVSITMTYVASPCYPTIILSDISTLYGGSNQPFYTAAAPYKGLLVYGAQVELGNGESSYIPTGGSTSQRLSDLCFIDTANIPSWFSYQNEATFKIVYQVENLLSTTNVLYLGQWGTEYSYGFQHYLYAGAGTTLSGNTKLTAATSNDHTGYSNVPLPRKVNIAMAVSQGLGTHRNCVDGGTVSSQNVSSFPTWTSSTIRLGLGTQGSSGTAGTANTVWLEKVTYYPKALSNTQLQELTSPKYVAPSFSVDFVPMSSEADLLAKGLTFRRLSNATFINTAGFMDFAGANMFPNSAFNDANSAPSGWNGFGFSATAIITIPSTDTEARKITTTSVSEQPFIYAAPTVTQGLVYTASIQILEVTDPTAQLMQYAQCISAPFASSFKYYMNGQDKGSGSGAITGETGILSIVYTAGSSSQIRIGYANVPKPNCSITFKAPQHQQGEVINRSTFYRRTFAEGTYYAPRFDNKVLTSRTNLVLQSNNFTIAAGTPWAQKDGTHLATVTAAYEAAPPGFTGTATRITSSNSAAGITQALNVPLVSGKTIRISFYAKSNTVTSQNCMLQSNSSTFAVSTIPTTWTRIDEVAVAAVTESTLKGFIDPLDISIYGMQVEYVDSSGATAYIPTTTTTTTVNTTEPIGLLNEGVSTNSLLYSQNLTIAPWTIQALGSGSYTTVSLTGGMAPNNTNTAIRFIEGTGSFSRSIYQNIALSANVYTASVFVKAGYGDLRYIRLVLSSAAGNYVHATVNITTGAVTQGPAVAGTGVSTPQVTVTPYAGSWYRISVTATFAAATNFFFIVPSNVATPAQNTGDYNRLDYVGNGASFLLWGAQVELGYGPTSYIPTGTTTVQRTPDLLAVTNTTAMGLNLLEGTFFTETELPRGGPTSPAVFGAPYANGSWLGQLYGASDATTLSANWWGAGAANISRGGVQKSVTALSYGTYTGSSIPVLSSLNGATNSVVFVSSGANLIANPSTWTFISLASNLTVLTSTSRDNLNACIKRFSYYPARLTNAQLIALTA